MVLIWDLFIQLYAEKDLVQMRMMRNQIYFSLTCLLSLWQRWWAWCVRSHGNSMWCTVCVCHMARERLNACYVLQPAAKTTLPKLLSKIVSLEASWWLFRKGDDVCAAVSCQLDPVSTPLGCVLKLKLNSVKHPQTYHYSYTIQNGF